MSTPQQQFWVGRINVDSWLCFNFYGTGLSESEARERAETERRRGDTTAHQERGQEIVWASHEAWHEREIEFAGGAAEDEKPPAKPAQQVDIKEVVPPMGDCDLHVLTPKNRASRMGLPTVRRLPREGIVEDLPAHKYHEVGAVGSTPVRKQHAKSHKHATQTVDETDSMRLGTLVHMAVLEPEEWQSRVVGCEAPVELSNSNHRKAARMLADGADLEDFFEEWSYKESTIRGYYENEDVREMAEYLQNHPYGDTDEDTVEEVEAIRDSVWEFLDAGEHDQLIEAGQSEVSIFWEDPETGERCKGRIDGLVELEDALLVQDFKTTGRGVSSHDWRRNVARRAYHVQAGHYMRGLEQIFGKPVEKWLWLTVETSEPYGVRLHECDRADFERCKADAQAALENFIAHREDDGLYDGYSTEISTISIPEYA